MILLSVICVVLSLELGVATPPGNRLEESRLQNEGNKEFNVEQNIGEPTNPYNIPKNENEPMPQENQKKILMRNEDYENMNTNNNPAFYNNVNEQPNVISENKEYNQNNAERNFNTLNDESSRPSYMASPPQVNRIQTFRPKDGESKETNMPRMVDILSEVENPKKDLAATESNAPIIQDKNPANQIMNNYKRQNSQTPEILNDKKEEEDTTQFDAPVATPEYIKSLYDENKQTKKYNVKSTITNMPKNDISNKDFQPNSQNVNEATFQNPSAEILYETGQAKPYEISNEPVYNSRQGQTHEKNILNDKQRLKNLYLSSKPTKHYMIVYPDGRVEQVDKLDKIQKKHPQYVMLNAKELLQHGKAKVPTGSQGPVEKQNLPITAVKPQSNSIRDTKDDQIDKAPQTVNEQTLPVPIEPFPVANEPSIISSKEVTKTNNVAKSSKEEVSTTIITEKNIQNQLQEGGINDSQEKNNLNNNENISSGAIVTSSDIASNQDSTTSTTETAGNEDIVTTARSTISTPIADTEILNQNIPNSLSTSNNTESSTLSKEPEDSNSTPSDNLINTKDDSIVAGENTTPIPKQESNEEDERTKNTTTITSDLNTIKENSYTPESIDTSNINYETNTSNSSLDSSTYREESNSTTKSNNETVITFEDGTESDGNTFHTEIITNHNDESNAQNAASNNVASSDDKTLITNSTETDVANSSTENTQNNFTSSNLLTKKDENNTDTKTIQIVSNVTNSEVNKNKNDDNNLKSYTSDINSDSIYMDASEVEESNLNKTLSADTKKTDSKYTDGTDDSDAFPNGSPNKSNDEDDPTSTGASNDNKVVALGGGAVSSNEEDSVAPATASNDSPPQGVNEDDKDEEDDEDDDTKNETKSEITNANDNLDTESLDNDGNIVNESSFVFNASESFWHKLMNSNEYNSFYFLFPRPQPNTKETKKITYPNGTVVVETTEIIHNDDGETTSSKTVVTCGNCTNCEKPL